MCEKKRMWARRRCQKTCGLCGPLQNTQPPIDHNSTDLLVNNAEAPNSRTEYCNDVLDVKKCKKLKGKRMCEEKPKLAKNKCKNTCGLCGPMQTISLTDKPTTTNPPATAGKNAKFDRN